MLVESVMCESGMMKFGTRLEHTSTNVSGKTEGGRRGDGGRNATSYNKTPMKYGETYVSQLKS